MTCARFLFSLLFFAAANVAAADSVRLGTDIVPFYQAVDLTVDPSTDSYSGTTSLSLEAVRPVSAIRLHADGIEISEVRLGLEGAGLPLSYELQGDILFVEPGAPLAPGKYSLTINFSNEFNKQAVGLYRVESDGLGYAFTQFEASDARKAFPCFDEPAFKIPFEISITARAGDEAVTNTPLAGELANDGWIKRQFAVTRPLPTYLLAIAVGPMESAPIPDLPVPGRIYTPRGKLGLSSYAADLAAPILQAQQAYFGMQYPYEKLDFVAIPEYWPGAMEHPGIITYKDSIILLDPETISADQHRVAVKVISHEFAHQWFGNLVTMEWWDDLWLNEAFADWLGDKIVMELFPETRNDLIELRSVNAVMTTDSRSTAEPIRNPVVSSHDLLTTVGLAYNKGKSVIGMFERWVGPEAFRTGVRSYLRENAWGNAQSADFWRALSAQAGTDVAASMETFLEQPGVPMVEAAVDGNTIRLAQRRFSNFGTELSPESWRIPVGLRVGAGGKVIEKTVLLTSEAIQVPIDGVDQIDWLMPNADGAGYYRWTIGDTALQAIAPGASELLNARERISFLGNLGALLDAGELGGDTYLRSLEAFASDPEPLVVSAVISELDGVRDAFITPELEEAFAAYVGQTLSPAIERFGIEPKAGEDEAIAGFRPRLLYWLGIIAGEETVVAWAADTTQRYLQAPSTVDPDLADVALKITAKQGDEALFGVFRERFESSQTPAARRIYLQSLGAFEDPAIQDRALAYSLDGPLYANEVWLIPGTVRNAYGGPDRVFNWMASHYDRFASRLPPVYLPFLPMFGGGCDRERMHEATAFFSQPGVQVEGTEKQMKKVQASVLDCISLREREGQRVADYLDGRGD